MNRFRDTVSTNNVSFYFTTYSRSRQHFRVFGAKNLPDCCSTKENFLPRLQHSASISIKHTKAFQVRQPETLHDYRTANASRAFSYRGNSIRTLYRRPYSPSVKSVPLSRRRKGSETFERQALRRPAHDFFSRNDHIDILAVFIRPCVPFIRLGIDQSAVRCRALVQFFILIV